MLAACDWIALACIFFSRTSYTGIRPHWRNVCRAENLSKLYKKLILAIWNLITETIIVSNASTWLIEGNYHLPCIRIQSFVCVTQLPGSTRTFSLRCLDKVLGRFHWRSFHFNSGWVEIWFYSYQRDCYRIFTCHDSCVVVVYILFARLAVSNGTAVILAIYSTIAW